MKPQYNSWVHKNATITLGQEPISIINYIRTGSSIKQPSQIPELKATLGPVNWGAVYPESNCKLPLPLNNKYLNHAEVFR